MVMSARERNTPTSVETKWTPLMYAAKTTGIDYWKLQAECDAGTIPHQKTAAGHRRICARWVYENRMSGYSQEDFDRLINADLYEVIDRAESALGELDDVADDIELARDLVANPRARMAVIARLREAIAEAQEPRFNAVVAGEMPPVERKR